MLCQLRRFHLKYFLHACHCSLLIELEISLMLHHNQHIAGFSFFSSTYKNKNWWRKTEEIIDFLYEEIHLSWFKRSHITGKWLFWHISNTKSNHLFIKEKVIELQSIFYCNNSILHLNDPSLCHKCQIFMCVEMNFEMTFASVRLLY